MTGNPVIDVHAHYIPASIYADMPEPAPDVAKWRGAMSDVDARLRDMDRSRIDIQLLSPWQGFFAREAAVAARYNNEIAATVRSHPDRFLGMATVPMAEPDKVAVELTRAVRELGFRGVTVGTNVRGTMLDNPAFEPLFTTAESLGVPVFLHPAFPLGSDRHLHEFALDNLIGFVTDTATAAARLTFSGLMARHPDLTIYLAHGGGSMPALRGRWQHGYDCGRISNRLPAAPLSILQRFWMDSLTHSPEVLRDLMNWPGHNQVMLGTDYPYDMGDLDARTSVEKNDLLNSAQKNAILSENALRLFRIR